MSNPSYRTDTTPSLLLSLSLSLSHMHAHAGLLYSWQWMKDWVKERGRMRQWELIKWTKETKKEFRHFGMFKSWSVVCLCVYIQNIKTKWGLLVFLSQVCQMFAEKTKYSKLLSYHQINGQGRYYHWSAWVFIKTAELCSASCPHIVFSHHLCPL